MWNNEEYGIVGESIRGFMYRVYGWMGIALALSASTAFLVSSNVELMKMATSTPMVIGLFLVQLGLVMFLSARIQTMDYSTALTAFVMYAFLSGVTFSVLFAVYTLGSLGLVFGITAGTFLTMALYGYFTKADLSAMGSFLIMGLFGLIISSLVNAWFRSPMADYYISLFGVGIFTLLTAYDVQKIKSMGYAVQDDQEASKKVALMGSLILYLDFVNLFIYLLRLFGKRKD